MAFNKSKLNSVRGSHGFSKHFYNTIKRQKGQYLKWVHKMKYITKYVCMVLVSNVLN